MMKKILLTILLIFAFTGVASAANYSYTIADNGTTKVLEQGDTFTLNLTESTSIGYTWVLAPDEGTSDNYNSLSNSLSDGLQFISSETIPWSTYIGAPRYHIWTIKAMNIGSQSVNIHYLYRGSEDTSKAFTLTINIENANPTNIPEFPSVAVPVAAILGLIVIFGRKKNTI
jgi:predicted secreted protein